MKIENLLKDKEFDKSNPPKYLIEKTLLFIFTIICSYICLEIIAHQTKSGLAVTGFFMLSVSLVLGITLKGAEVIDLIKERKNNKQVQDILQSIVQQAKLHNNYKPMNTLLMSNRASSYIIELGFYINKYHNGSWLDKDKLTYPKEWGDDFFKLMSKFFKEERERRSIENKHIKKFNNDYKKRPTKLSQINDQLTNINPFGSLIKAGFKEEPFKLEEKTFQFKDLSDFELQATFLATVKPDIVQQVVDGLDKKGI